LGNIGSVYRDKAENKKALDFYSDSISIFEEIGDKMGTANQCANIGYIYAVDEKKDEALKWFKKALPLYEELQRNELAASTRHNIQNLSRSES
jgi:tetratricopeptide (TPR) repeat protein